MNHLPSTATYGLALLVLTSCSNPATTPPRCPDHEDAAVEPACPMAVPAPHNLPGTRPEHRNPGFWISRAANPDEIILGPEEIDELNRRAHGLAREQGGLSARYALLDGATSPDPILGRMAKALEHHRQRAEAGGRFTQAGAEPSPEFFARLETLQKSTRQTSAFHVIHQTTPLRCHPTREQLYEAPGDIDFDLLLCSTLRPGEAVRVIGEAQEGWRLVRSDYVAGWVEAEQLAPALEAEELRSYLMADPFVVVVEDRAPIWATPERRRQLAAVRTGLRLPLRGSQGPGLVRVLSPSAEGLVEGYIETDVVNEGYLPMTRREVLTHAFAHLDDAFGWAGDGGDRDCSRFLMDLFALFGLRLPRNSYFQSQATSFSMAVAEDATIEQRQAALDQANERGLAFIFMPGHIMLFLGRDGEDYFALHQFSGYRVGCRPDQDVKMVVDRLSVTTLRLGEGSGRRSFMERFTALAVLGQTAPSEAAP